MGINATTVLTIPKLDEELHEGDIIRFEQAATEGAAKKVGQIVAVARLLEAPHELPEGRIGLPVKMLPEEEGENATVAIQVEAKARKAREALVK